MRIFAIVFFIFILVGFDQFSKTLAVNSLSDNTIIPVIGEFLRLQLSYNSGIAFSIPLEWIILKWVTLFALFAILYYYVREEFRKSKNSLDVAYIFIFAGAISHAYERIYIGHVVDFIAVKYFAILNFADIFITIGAFILILYYGINRKPK